ncbi:diacylglycerol/lipid kinase family protein [Phocaeicola oris]|uniref:diacylglycerol/lipid kinase family protein n=1 Tax=Phocaeicola oris TaxID=2896850 RepID=UPI00234F2BF2|nr:diacylglycerol kinase family protein [Phocaeicola oris]MCE2615367.1 diacylglycerol kinase family lipid kinase [Phocaeicola oris]
MAVDLNRWGIIYNPKAGTRKKQKRWNKIRQYMESKNVMFDYVQSEGYGSIERLARILADNGYKTIVVVGGDGAINDAINGILTSNVPDKASIAFGIIPNGTGNDFAGFWGLDEDDYKHAIDCIINHRTRKIDVGICNFFNGQLHVSRYFVNAIYIGLGAKIVQYSSRTERFWGMQTLSFINSMVLLGFERKQYRTHIRVNGEHISGRFMTVCIGNCQGYGQTPSASPYNGLLDVSVVDRPKFGQLISGLWMLLRGRFLNHKVVHPYRTKEVKVLRAQNAPISLDGRLLKEKHFPLKVNVLPEAMTLIIPN